MQKVIYAQAATRKQLFRKLRALYTEHGHNQDQLTVPTGRSESYINDRMAGRREWRLEDCYNILDYYEIDHAMLPEYFPRGGIT